MTIVPRTREGSASSAPLTTAWYQAGKSSDCLGSATAQESIRPPEGGLGESNPVAAASSRYRPTRWAEDDRGQTAGQQHRRGGSHGVGDEQGHHVDAEDDAQRAEPAPGGCGGRRQ